MMFTDSLIIFFRIFSDFLEKSARSFLQQFLCTFHENQSVFWLLQCVGACRVNQGEAVRITELNPLPAAAAAGAVPADGGTSCADPGFWSGGPSRVLTPGGLSPKFAQRGYFCLKMHDFGKILGVPGFWSGGPAE